MDPHEDLVSQNRAVIDAHRAEIVRLSSENPDADKADVLPEDQAVLDAKQAVDEAQAALIKAQQAAYVAKTERADADAAKAKADAEAETADKPMPKYEDLVPPAKPSSKPQPVTQ